MMALMNSLLLISLAGSRSRKDLVEKVGQHRLAEGGHIRALGDSLHEVVTHLLVLDIGG